MKGLTAATRSPCHEQVLSELLQAQLMLKATQGTGIDIHSHYRRNGGETLGGGVRWFMLGLFEPTEFRCQIAFLGTPECDSCPCRSSSNSLLTIFQRRYLIKQPGTESQV